MSRIFEDVGFVHLHVHSSYSLLEGALSIANLCKFAEKDRQPALALTDTNNLFGALEFSQKISGSGIQPIPGIQLSVEFEKTEIGARPPLSYPHIVLLAQNEEGYGNLLHLVNHAYFDVPLGDIPRIHVSLLQDLNAGLIALTGGLDGSLLSVLKETGKPELAQTRLTLLKDAFKDRLYVEIQRHKMAEERAWENALITLADANSLPLVATNEPFFAHKDDFEAHDALLAIAEGTLVDEDDRRHLTPEFNFKSRDEMRVLFSDLPEALAASVDIAMRCSYRVATRKPILPSFHIGEDDQADETAEMRRQAEEGLRKRLKAHGFAEGKTEQDYWDRLHYELDIIERMEFPGYFLIVADFIKWSKEHDIPVGPGRGSGAGSLVAYALTITDLDPLRFSLLFERFLNPERVSMPDFDIDFCVEGRERVIDYVQKRYGETQVAQIITFGTLLARGVMRDVGRVLQMSYGHVDKLTKLVPQNPANPVTLKQAIDDEPRLQTAMNEEPVVARMLAIAQKLEGLHRHASTHAAGVVIGDRPLEELVPLYRDPKTGMRVTQFNMKWVEQAGLVKFDFLGLKTLTVLRRAVDLIRQNSGVEIDLSSIPLDDPKTYAMLQRGETVGVFQLESSGMRKALTDMEADRFEDLIALVALYRPGPMANIPVYCARKLGKEDDKKDTWYIEPRLEPVLNETFGIIVYQEQVMQVAQILAGYTLGDADLLRRAMGKKIKSEMDAQRSRFVSGAAPNGISEKKANEIFDLLARFADYGFNKSHAAAYALVAYQTAYLKANYPVEFLAASMTMDMDNTDKLSDFRREAQRLGITVVPPDINHSGATFLTGDQTIYYALSAVKGVGRSAIEAIVERRGNEPFKNPTDFASRVNPRLVNKRILENLTAAGAFDALEPDRARMTASVDQIIAEAQRVEAAENSGVMDMFGGEASMTTLRIPPYQPWTAMERLKKEYDAVGFFLSGHPLDEYQTILEKMRVQSWADFTRAVKASGSSVGKVAATVLSRQEKRTKSGNKMGVFSLSDQTGHFEAITFSEALQQYRDILDVGKAVILTVHANIEGEDIRARIQEARLLDEAAMKLHRAMHVFLKDEQALSHLKQQLIPNGDSDVSLILILNEGKQEIEMKLPGRYKTSPQLAGALRVIPGVIHVDLV